MKKILIVAGVLLAGVIVLFGLIQLIPYGKNHTNPPVVSEPNWDSAQTRQLAQQACFDCHSNETIWPAYSNLAPISWLVQFDVDRGRRELNFSDWQVRPRSGNKVVGPVNEGEMPPLQYTLMHPNAKLNSTERQQLIDGLITSLP